MMVMLKILFLWALVYKCKADTIFDNIYTTQVRNQATACVLSSPARVCRGVLWQKDWLLMNYSCLAGNPFATVIVKKGNVNCTNETTTSASDPDLCSRHTLAHYKHPLYPDVDLALLQLHTPYTSMEMFNHTSNNIILLQKVDVWMKNILYTDSVQKEHMLQEQNNHLQMYSTPVNMFLFSVVLPAVSFVIFFIYVIFFTGSNNSSNIPYKSLYNDKKDVFNRLTM